MSWLGRLFGRSSGPVMVRLPADLAEALDNQDGRTGLDAAVERVLRAHLDGSCRATPDDTERKPFWLSRRDGPEGDLEGELRDRMAQRRVAEAEDEEGELSPPRPPSSPRTRRPSRG